jgi:hypothetical protein
MAMIYLGLASLGLRAGPVRPDRPALPNAPMVFMGVLIGGFLMGRPFALFGREGAALPGPVFLVLSYAVGDRLRRWLSPNPRRMTVIIAAAPTVAGALSLRSDVPPAVA